MIVGTFGTVLLRPYYLVIGVPTTGVAWLMNRNDLLWAPRFFPAEALLWCITLVGFASVARAVPRSSERMRTAVFTTSIVIAALSASAQLALVPWFARGAHLLRSTSHYSSSERQEADAVFGRYRREGKPEEPVVASIMLFRYAHDRNLFWLTRLHGRPAPIWILGDSADVYAPPESAQTTINAESGIHLEDYQYLTVAAVSCCSKKGVTRARRFVPHLSISTSCQGYSKKSCAETRKAATHGEITRITSDKQNVGSGGCARFLP